MANKDLFKDAIAEAKSIRATAIANAKEALEETLTPHIKDMLAAKLQEMEDSSVEEEVVTEEEVEEEVTETVEETVEEVAEETVEENFIPVEEAEEEKEDEAEDKEDEEEDEAEEEADNDSEESEEEAEEEESEEEDIDLKDMSVDDLKDLIKTIVAQEADLEGEEALDGVEDLTGDEEELDSTGMEAGEELPAEVPGEEAVEDEEINLEALLAELEALSEGETCDTCGAELAETNCTNEGGCGKHKNEEVEEEVTEAEVTEAEVTEEEVVSEEEVNEEEVVEESNNELEEALATIETLRTELNETNILNAKLLYVNKVLKANRNLSESQVVNVISAFDKAETVKEVKLVFETVSENVVTKSQKSTIKESNLGSASKATGLTGKKPEVISEANAAVLRMQKLAGII